MTQNNQRYNRFYKNDERPSMQTDTAYDEEEIQRIETTAMRNFDDTVISFDDGKFVAILRSGKILNFLGVFKS